MGIRIGFGNGDIIALQRTTPEVAYGFKFAVALSPNYVLGRIEV